MEEGGSSRLRYDVQDVRTFGVDQDDMLHFPGFGFDGMRAMSVIQYAARNATGNAAAMDEYSGRFFRGGSHPSVVLEVPGKMTDDAIVNLQTAYANKYGGIDNAHRVPLVLTNGISAKPVTINASDAQLLEARKFQVSDIARAFGLKGLRLFTTVQLPAVLPSVVSGLRLALAQAWLFLVAAGLFGTSGHMCWMRALKIGDVSLLAPISFVQMPIVESDGISYMVSIIRDSMIERSPLAPVFLSIAFSAIASTASGSKVSLTWSKENSF